MPGTEMSFQTHKRYCCIQHDRFTHKERYCKIGHDRSRRLLITMPGTDMSFQTHKRYCWIQHDRSVRRTGRAWSSPLIFIIISMFISR
jgi:hypothetical protein